MCFVGVVIRAIMSVCCHFGQKLKGNRLHFYFRAQMDQYRTVFAPVSGEITAFRQIGKWQSFYSAIRGVAEKCFPFQPATTNARRKRA